MPYAPGVQDISGQLRAQGIAQAGQAWSQAIGNIGQSLNDAFNSYRQNQFITNQALGKFAAASRADGSILKFLESGGEQEDPNAPKVPLSPEVLKAYSNAKTGKIGVNDAAMLGAFVDSWQKNKQEKLQTEMMQLKVDEARRQAEFFKNLGAEATPTGTPPPAGGIAPMPPPAAPAAPVEQPRYDVATPSPNPAVPAMLSRFAAPQPQPAGAQAAVAMLGAQAPAAAERPSGVATKQDLMQAYRTLGPGAGQKDVEKLAGQMAQDRLKAFTGEAVFTGASGQDQAQTKADRLNAEGKAPSGMTYVTKYDGASKGWYADLVVKPKTSAEESALAGEKARTEAIAKADVEEASKFVSDINTSAAAAIDDRARRNRIRELYSQGAESGQLADWTAAARTALSEVGLGEKAKVAKDQELRALLAVGALQAARKYYKGQGSTSNAERERIDNMVEAYNKGQISNEAILDFAEAHDRKLTAASRYDLALKKQKVPLDERGTALQQWWLDNPVDKYMGDGTTVTYVLNEDGVMVPARTQQAKPAASTTATQQTAAPQGNIGRFKVIGVK